MYKQTLCLVKMVRFENKFVNLFTLYVCIRINTNTPSLMCMLRYNTGDKYIRVVNALWIWTVWHTRRSVIFVMATVRKWGNWSLLHPTRRVIQIPRRYICQHELRITKDEPMHTRNAWIVWKCTENYQITLQKCYRVSSVVSTHNHISKTEPIKNK